MEFSSLGIFWLSFAAFIIPVFTIALICSIIKAVRTRKVIKRRMRDRSLGAPRDAEIVTYKRQKPKIQIIEDENRRNEFRGSKGSLHFPSRTNLSPKALRDYKDFDVDGNPSKYYDRNKNRDFSIIEEEGDQTIVPTNANASNANNNSSIMSTNKLDSPSLSKEIALPYVPAIIKSNYQHVSNSNSSSSNGTIVPNINSHYNNNKNNNNNMNNHFLTVNANGQVPNGRKYTKHDNSSNRRRRSLDSQYPSYYSQTQNGHIPERRHSGDEKDAMIVSSISRRRLDHGNPGLLKPQASRSRRHSLTSATPILERIPEAVVTEVEMNNVRSRSEDHLVDPNVFSSPCLAGKHQGTDNKGFTRSTETTIM